MAFPVNLTLNFVIILKRSYCHVMCTPPDDAMSTKMAEGVNDLLV